jgi:hypothetical protein
MDIPIDLDELRDIVIGLQIAGSHTKNQKFDNIADRLKLVEQLIFEGKPYKKILREEYNIVA